jgi:hypothetical protein
MDSPCYSALLSDKPPDLAARRGRWQALFMQMKNALIVFCVEVII